MLKCHSGIFLPQIPLTVGFGVDSHVLREWMVRQQQWQNGKGYYQVEVEADS